LAEYEERPRSRRSSDGRYPRRLLPERGRYRRPRRPRRRRVGIKIRGWREADNKLQEVEKAARVFKYAAAGVAALLRMRLAGAYPKLERFVAVFRGVEGIIDGRPVLTWRRLCRAARIALPKVEVVQPAGADGSPDQVA
jgi:hypothetical protein